MTWHDDSRWAALMAAAQSGDRQSYAQLLREIMPFLRRVVRQEWRMGSAADLEDVVQETLLTIHAVRHTYDPRRPFTPWLLTLLQRRTVDAIRRQARASLREVPLDPADVTFSVDPANNQQQESAVDGETLRKAVAALPPGQRQAIELLKHKGLSLKEASAATGMSIAALKVATHRALKTLRATLTSRKHHED